MAAWTRAHGGTDTASGTARDLFDHALATSRTGDYATAAVVYRRVIAQHPSSHQADEATYKLGYLPYDKGQWADAIAAFSTYLRDRPRGGHALEARWFLAWAKWQSGDLEGARQAFDGIVRSGRGGQLLAGARYWRARAAGELGDTAAMNAGFDDVLKRSPESAYAWFVLERRGQLGPGSTPPPAEPPGFRFGTVDTALAHGPGSALLRALNLEAVGFHEDAIDQWTLLIPVLGTSYDVVVPTGDAESPTDDARSLAWHLVELGAMPSSRRVSKALCQAAGRSAYGQPVCLPRPASRIVHRIATARGLDPLLPYAIMTAESAMKPYVTSPAGARGLMQMMPRELPRVHAAAFGDGGPPPDPDRLYDALYNAAVGTTELGLRRQSLDGLLDGDVLPAVIASYNAGEDAVRRWASDDTPPPDVFAETIGYTETRRYVRRVLGYLMRYRRAYAD